MSLNYILTIKHLPPNPLPYIYFGQAVSKSSVFFGIGNCETHGFKKNYYQLEQLQDQLMIILERTRTAWQAKSRGRARTSLYHNQYLTLVLGNRSEFNMSNDVTVSCGYKGKGRPHLFTLFGWGLCSLSTLRENKSVFHFVACYLILRRIRLLQQGKIELNFEFSSQVPKRLGLLQLISLFARRLATLLGTQQ